MRKSEQMQVRRGYRLVASLLAVLLVLSPGWVLALPNGGEIVSGTGNIQQPTAQDMVINQSSQQLITNWQGFSIGSAESVTFKQPNSSSVALNRVIGVDPSVIMGKLSANGQVFLSNPSGVVFSKGAVVDVHGLLATTLSITDKDFLEGNYQFTQDPDRSLAAIINDGTIQGTLNPTRYVGLVAPAIENNGTIVVADLGSVALASGTAATLDFNGDGLIRFVVTGEVVGDVLEPGGKKKLKDRISNSGIISANGGQVLLTAKSAGKLIGDVVNHTGLIEARSAYMADGKIILSSGGEGNIGLSGKLDASHVFVTAEAVSVAASEYLSTNNGNVHIEANDLDLKGVLDSGTGDVSYTRLNGSDLEIKAGNNPGGGVGSNDLGNIIAKNLTLKTDGNISVKGIKEADTAGITDKAILESGGDISFNTVASVFRALRLFAGNDINVNAGLTTNHAEFFAVNDINVNAEVTATRTNFFAGRHININADVTTTDPQGDFIAVANSEPESDGIGDFNVAPGAVVTSERDIDVKAVNINFDEPTSFDEGRDLILNDEVIGDGSEPTVINNEIEDAFQQASLATFLTQFFENGGPGGC